MNIKHRIQKWLDVKEPIEPKLNKELKKQVDQLKKDLEFWHKTFRSFSVIPCGYCKKQMRVYPYGGAYYTTHDGKKVHAGCYDEYLSKDKGAV